MEDYASNPISGQINDERISCLNTHGLFFRRKIRIKWSFLEAILLIMSLVLFCIILCFFVLYLIIDQVPCLFSNNEIKKPLLDNRKYEIIQLLNGMNVMLISDPNLSSAAVGLSVNSGFSDDEKYKLSGIGNLVYNVILNKKQLSEINDHLYKYYGNSINHEMSMFDLNLGYEIGHEGFLRSIEIFSEIIKFNYRNETEELIDSILEAVNKLNDKQGKPDTLNKDSAIMNIIYKALDYNKSYFPNGSQEKFINSTHRIEHLVSAVLKYYDDNYIGSNMKLVVLTKLSLKEIKGIVIKLFSNIPANTSDNEDKKVFTGITPVPPISKHNLGKIVVMKLSDKHIILKFVFIFDKVPYNTTYLYFEYLKYVFNDKQEGSLYHLLQKNNFISSMFNSYDFIKENTVKFEISYQITQDGFDYISQLIYQTFNFIRIIRNQKVNETIYEDMKKVRNINFKFREYDSSDLVAVCKLAHYMNIFSDHLTDLQIADNYTPELNHNYLNAILGLMTPENVIVLFNQKQNSEKAIEILKKMTGIKDPFTFIPDDVFNVEFAQAYFSKSEIKKMLIESRFDNFLKIRNKNEYLTNLIKLVSPEDDKESKDSEIEKTKLKPNVIFQRNHIKIWHKLDRTFRIPKVNIDLIINSPFHPSDDKDSYVLFLFHYQFLATAINQELSDAKEGGTSIQILSNDATIGIYIQAFSDVYEKVLTKVLNLYYNPDSSVISESVISSLTNAKLEVLKNNDFYRNSNELMKGLLKNKLMVVFNNYEPITQTNIISDIKKTVNQSYFRALVYGNLEKNTTLDWIKNRVMPNIDTSSIYFSILYKLENDTQIFDYLAQTKDIQNNVVFRFNLNQMNTEESIVANYFYLGTTDNYRDSIFIQLIKLTVMKDYKTELLKNTLLRHKTTNLFNLGTNWYLSVIAAAKMDPRDINKILDNNLILAEEKLKQLDEKEEMYKIKESIFSYLTAKEKNLHDRTLKIRTEIKLNRYDFDPKKNYTIEQINSEFTKDALLDKFKELFKTKVKKLSLQRNASNEITFEDEGYVLNKTIATIVTNDTSHFH